jgi:hypothetical protein
MDESSPILVEEQNGTLRIAWDNRRVPTDAAEARSDRKFWIVCALLTLLFTGLIFVPDADVVMFFRMPFIWCAFFGWLFTIGLPLSWITKTWSEWIELSKDSFSIGQNGFLVLKPWRTKSFPFGEIVELAYGSYQGGYVGTKADPSITLTVILCPDLPASRRSRWSYRLGSWLTPDLRVQVFKTIEQFVIKNRIPLKLTRFGPLFKKPGSRPRVFARPKPSEIPKPYPIEVIEHDEKLRLQWDTRRLGKKKDEFWGLVCVLTVWTGLTILITYSIFRPDTEIFGRVFCAFWCINS